MCKINYIPFNEYSHLFDDEIRTHFSDMSTQELADKLGLNFWTVKRRAYTLGLHKSAAFRRKASSSAALRPKHQLTDAEKAYIKEHYACTPNTELARRFGCSTRAINRAAAQLGVKKSEDYVRQRIALGTTHVIRAYYTHDMRECRRQRIAAVYPTASRAELEALAKELGIHLTTLAFYARHFGIKRTKEATRRCRLEAAKPRRKYFSDAFLKEFSEYFSNHSNRECDQYFNLPRGISRMIASRNGFKKTPEYMEVLRNKIIINLREARMKNRNNPSVDI